MIPQKCPVTHHHQTQEYQHSQCVYHNPPLNSSNSSLYTDHHCNKLDFSNATATILQGHSDEVWNMQWSHDGTYLATCGKDKAVVVWKMGISTETGAATQEWSTHLILRDHQYPVSCLAWSLNDSMLLTSAEQYIMLWNAQTGACIETLTEHSDTITALAWFPSGLGFISGALDGKVIHWNADRKPHDSWGFTPIRVTDLAITPDFTRLITVGVDRKPLSSGGSRGPRCNSRIIVYDLATKTPEFTVALGYELPSISISQNSRYALTNLVPDEIRLWDLDTTRIACRYRGHKESRHVIRSCFGGVDGHLVVSGSEDGKVYIWHRKSGSILGKLSGHGEGSVNTVAWHPRNERMFASCSDDHTVRIWELPVLSETE